MANNDEYHGRYTGQIWDQTVDDVSTLKTGVQGLDSRVQALEGETHFEPTETQRTAMNSGIDSTKVAQIAQNTADIANKQNELTTAQMAAVNSGITSSLVESIPNKQEALSETQLTAVNSGITASKVEQIVAITDSGAKNLIKMTHESGTVTRYGVTCLWDAEAGTMTLNGEHTASDSAAIFEIYSGNASDQRVLPAGEYHLSGCPIGGSTATYRATLSPMSVVDTGDGKDFTLTEPSYAAYRILISGDVTFDNMVFRPMVCTKDAWNTSTTFEPYRPTYSELTKNAIDAKNEADDAVATLEISVKGTKTNLLASNIAEICNSNADNLPNNSVFGIKVNYKAISNLPPYVYTLTGSDAQNAGTIITFGKEKGRGYGDTQFFIGYGSQTYVRVYAGTWQVWRKLSTARYKRILGIGDSICEGWRNENMGFAGMLGVPYSNKGVTGATLGYREGKTQIYTEMDDLSGVYDCVISDGGINDYYFNVPLGTASTRPVVTANEADALDKTTVSGGLEYLFYLMINRIPRAQRYFLITHKTGNYPYTENSAGYTQQQLHDRIVEICRMYNVKPIDVYEESLINSAYDIYVSPTAYSSDHSVTTQYHVDHDRIHPLWLGYFEGYLPIIEQALQTATIKTS